MAAAIDFALGTLDGIEMRAAELRLRRDRGFARAVEAWQRHLAPLAESVRPMPAPPAVWSAIDAELFRSIPPVVPRRSVWSSLNLWRTVAAGTSIVAAVSVALLAVRPAADGAGHAPDPAEPAAAGKLLAASMASTDKSAVVMLTATYDPDRGSVVLTPAARNNSRGLTPELWIIVGKSSPRSLGTIDLRGGQPHRIPDAMRAELKSGATLAISLEPAGGSPTGSPTGPVVATGTLSAL